MKIKSAEFIKGIVGEDELLTDGLPQIVFIGRSNVGKSSLINALTNRKDLARSSARPGKTREINLYLINKDFYLVDLPGYGYAKASLDERDYLRKLIYWYLLFSKIQHKKIIMIIDAVIGLTEYDLTVLRRLDEQKKDVVIVANKIDKIKKSAFPKRIKEIKVQVGDHKLIPCSTTEKTGLGEILLDISKAV